MDAEFSQVVRDRAYRDQMKIDVGKMERAAQLHKEKMLLMSAESSARLQARRSHLTIPRAT